MTRLVRDVQHLCEVFGIAFSDEQVAAITAPTDAPGVIVAGAGSGKTTVMAARVVWLVGHEEMEPGAVLGLTFTKKAAAELGQRVRGSLLGMADARTVGDLFDTYGEPAISTYHAFAGHLISEHGLRLGLETDLVVTSDATRHQRASRVIRRYREPVPHLTTLLPATIVRVLALDAALSEHLVTPHALREHDAGVAALIDGLDPSDVTKPMARAREVALERIDLSRLVEAYRDDKRASGVVDFADQMAGGARLGIECPEVGEQLRERFHVVLLDEYQDTSVAQRLMLQGLFGGGHPITAVGDPAQAIYGWRGASADNLARFTEHFPDVHGRPGRVHGLRTSRRCHPDILDVANRAAVPFYAAHAGLEPLVAPQGRSERAAEITAQKFTTVSDELDAVVDQVVAARTASPAEKIAVLLRTRAEMPTLTSALRRRGVDAEVIGLAGLLTLPHVSDVVSVLDVVADATANPSMLRLLTGDRWRIGPRDLALLGRRANVIAAGVALDTDDSLDGRLSDAVSGADPTEIVSLADAVEDPGDLPYSAEARARFAEVASIVRSVRRGLGASVADIVLLAIRRLDLDVETSVADTGASADLAALVDVADDVTGHSDVDSLTGFLSYLRAEEEFGTGLEVPDRARPGAVQILTIHTAKGLEWDRVFVPFVVSGTFPSTQGREKWTSTAQGFPYALRGDADELPRLAAWTSKGLDDLAHQFRQDALSEEIRLAYVAFTRARTALHVSGHWWGRTQVKPRPASQFLEVVAEVCAEQGRPATQWSPPPTESVNPELDVDSVAWPRPQVARPRRERAADLVRAARTGRLEVSGASGGAEEAEQLAAIASIDDEIVTLREAAAAGPVEVPLPGSLSTTAVLDLMSDEQAFAQSLARPMPRRPSTAARFGTRFHAWVEAHYGVPVLLDPTELPGRGDADLGSDAELDRARQMFLAGPFADRKPVAIEAPFALMIGDQQVIGRIDAVFSTDDGVEVVDWKTNVSATADPLQLAIYRLAWAELNQISLDQVTAAFYYVRLGEVHRFGPAELPDRAEIERRLA